MISITLMFETVEGAITFLQSGEIPAGQSVTIAAPPEKPKPEKKRGKRPANPTAAKVEATPMAPAADAEEAYEAVKIAALKLTHTKGRDKLVEVLAAHGFKTAMDAPVEAYMALIADMEAATTAADEELV